jgi:pSer/pThr/pTyr-binding forkhead associated (FHA) protein
MPILKWFPPQGSPRTFVLYKPMSTIGRALGNDVAVMTGGISETHAQVLFDGRDFNLEEVDKTGEILINGKKKRRARLVHGDRLTLGDAELQFSIFDEPHGPSRPAQTQPVSSDPPGRTRPAPARPTPRSSPACESSTNSAKS